MAGSSEKPVRKVRPRAERSAGAESVERPSTKALLIATAEQLFGRFGLDGVSLREIATAAGQSNNNVVQYHFGDKAGLIGAILDERVRSLEPLRGALLETALSDGAPTLRQLLRVLWQPILSIHDVDGMHSFGRFLLQHMLQPQLAPHPIHRFFGAVEESAPDSPPAYVTATRLLRAQCARLPAAVLSGRLRSLSLMFLATLVEHDNAQLGNERDSVASFDVEAILDMALAALAVEPTDSGGPRWQKAE